MELGTAVDEASRATGGGENSCVVSTPMQWKHFIWTGWLEAACRGMQSAGGGSSSMSYNFVANDGSDGVKTIAGESTESLNITC